MAEKTPNPVRPGYIPLNTRPDHKEISARGGRSTSEAKTIGAVTQGSIHAKCKNCRIQCFLKQTLLANDGESVCPVPEARAIALVHGTQLIHPIVFQKLGMDALSFMMGKAIERNDPKLMKEVHTCLMNQQRVFEGIPMESKVEQTFNILQYIDNAHNDPRFKIVEKREEK